MAEQPEADAHAGGAVDQQVDRRVARLQHTALVVDGVERDERRDRVAHVVASVSEAGEACGEHLQEAEEARRLRVLRLRGAEKAAQRRGRLDDGGH